MKVVWVALVLGLFAQGSVAQTRAEVNASPVGLWQTISDVDGEPRALVRLQLIGGEIRGVVAGTLRQGEGADRTCERCSGARRNQPISGMTILWGLHRDPSDPRQFINGSVLDPDTGDVYSARLRVSPDGQTLQLRGYFVLPIAGRSQTWLRAP